MSKRNRKNQGEGDRVSAREYNADLQKFVSEKRVEPAAKAAKDYVDANPAAAKASEERAAAGPEPVAKRIEELRTEARAMWSRAKARVRSIVSITSHREK